MAGLFDTLALGSRSLQTYRKAIDTAGHNLANVNTPGYTRQRLVVESVTTTDPETGATGMGAEATRIVQLRNDFTQKQLQTEASLEGSLTVKDDALRQTLTALQEAIDRNSDGGTTTNGISQKLTEFFTSLQSLSTNPGSLPDRKVVLQKAQELATKFNQIDQRLTAVAGDLNNRVGMDVEKANSLITQIADLNGRIAGEESGTTGFANDLRDSRQAKIEELSGILKIDAIEQANGVVNILVSGQSLVEGVDIMASLEAFDPGQGDFMVRLGGQAGALTLGPGSLEGAISVRDGQLAEARKEINDLASAIISEVNAVHTTGFAIDGSTGATFFEGTDASTMMVNRALMLSPALLQASAAADQPGDNTNLLALIALERKGQASLGNQTFFDKHTQTVTSLAQELATAKTDLEDQQAMSRFVRSQRDAVSAVSLDEEMANLVMFQKAFQASAKLISMTDEMLATIIGM